jgi:hypothetical protein
MVFGAVHEFRIQAEGVPPRTTGVTGGFDMIGTLELAIALQPEARELFVLALGHCAVGQKTCLTRTISSKALCARPDGLPQRRVIRVR